MRRRDLIKIFAGLPSLVPLAAYSQPAKRQIGVLMGIAPTDSQGQEGLTAFKTTLGDSVGSMAAMFRSMSGGGRPMSVGCKTLRKNSWR
jgi:hypothetical protein